MASAGPFVVLFLGASLFGLATRVALPAAPWIALTLLVHATRSLRPAPGLVTLWLALYVTMAIAKRSTLPVPVPIFGLIIAFDTTIVALAFFLDRTLMTRAGGVVATLILPTALVAGEFLRSRFTPTATWGSIAYSQYGFLPLMQVASVVGIWGMTFVIGWFASTFALAWSRSIDWSAIRGPALLCGITLGLIVLAGYARLALARTDRTVIRMATLNRPVDLFGAGEMDRISEGRVSASERAGVDDQLSRLHDWFLDGSRREARAGARVVVWPEQNLLIFREDEPAFFDRARRLAKDEHIYLAMGMGTIYLGDDQPLENKFVLIDPSGRIVITHRKTKPVVGWEERIMKRGASPIPVVATPDGRIAGAICYEADFPELLRQVGQGDADLLIVPANDWKAIKGIHFQMQVFRAIENGVPLLRAAASGISAGVDAWGRVLGVADFFATGDGTMTVQVPIGHVPTLYSKTGDLFAWLCVAAVVIAIAVALA